MDRKSIVVIAVCFILLGLWSFVIMPKLYPARPLPAQSTNAPAVSQTAESTNTPAVPGPTPAPAPATNAANPLALDINTNVPEQLLVVSNDTASYTFTSYGGGLKLVQLRDYPETVANSKNESSNHLAALNEGAPAPTLAVLDGPAVQGDGIFKLTRTANGVRAEKQLTNGLTLVKDFVLSSNYLVNATVRLENHSTGAISIPRQQWVIGTATPMNPEDRGTYYIGAMWSDGHKASDVVGSSYFSSHGFACMPRTPPSEYRAGETNVAWAAVHNQFFALAVIPEKPAAQVVMRELTLPKSNYEGIQPFSTNGYIAALVYPATTIPASQSVEHRFLLYAGPKEYHLLSNLAVRLKTNLDAIMNFGFFAFFAKALLLVLNFFHALLLVPYGWAVVLITVILRMAFWPLTAASTRSMKRMQTLQPQMNALKEKYKDDPAKMNKKLMEFMKENRVNPMSGCLPMLIQMPVFFGFYGMLRGAIELRGASWLWVSDLSKPDTLFTIPGLSFIPFISTPEGLPFNLLPLLMGFVMVWQAHLTPQSPGMDPAQQKLMRFMPAFFLLFLYNYSSGMALYIFVSTLLSVIQTKMTKTKQTAAPAPAASPALTRPKKKKK